MPRPRTRRQEAPIDFDEGLPSTATPVEADDPPRRRLAMEDRPQAGQRHKQELDFGDDPPEIREAVFKGEPAVDGDGDGDEGGDEGDDGEPGAVEKVVWSTKRINGFPDSSFLHIKPGGKKDSDGKIVPRTLRMFPVRDETGRVDLPHVRNAIARAPQASIPKAVQDKVQAAARKLLDQAKAGDIQTTASKADAEKRRRRAAGGRGDPALGEKIKKPSHTEEERRRRRKIVEEGLKKQGTKVQTLIFSKDKFTRAQAIAWAKDHDFRADKVDETENSFRLRQRDPAGFQRLRTISLTDGVQAVVGPLKKAQKALMPVLTWEAVRAGDMPALGETGLPESLKQDVPPQFRYWKCATAEEALLVREALVEARLFTEDTIQVVDGEPRLVRVEWVQKLYLPPPLDEIREDLEPTVPEALPPVAKAALMLSASPNKTTLFPHEIVKAIGLDVVLEGTGKLKTDWVVAAEDTPEVRKAMGEGFKLPNYGDLIFATNAEVEDPYDDLEWFEYSRADELIKHAFREGREIPIFKFDTGEEERTILGIVMEPNEVDSQNDKVSVEEIRQAAHKFMEDFGNLGKQHGEIVNGKLVLLETYIAPVSFDVEGQHVKKGSWLFLERVVDDELWTAVKKGEFTGFSIGGSAVRKPVP